MHVALNETLAALPADTKVYVRVSSHYYPSSPRRSFWDKADKALQPGHEYTKANCKFLTTVLQTEPVQKLQSFAENNRETQGKFTIGDEKVNYS